MWFNSDIRHSIKRLRYFAANTSITLHNIATSDMIDSLEKALQGKITAAKLTFESQLINTYTLTNNNKIFKSITKSDNISSVINLESFTANIDHSIANL